MKLRFIGLTFLLLTIVFTSSNISAKHPVVVADDEWLSLSSKNFFLIGNAKEKDLRDVATKLEQFRETFRLLFPNVKFSQAIETNVVVFKSKEAYKPFLPKRVDGKADTGIAGYFQSGEDVNYITLSTQGKNEDTYGTIFHEYIHFLLNTNFGRSEIPPWFNEGLAEYYQTFKIENDQKVFLGKLQNNHLRFLERSKLIPLKQFFEIDNYSLHKNGNHSRSIFYAQAWLLVHYLIQTNQSVNMSKFLQLVMSDIDAENSFNQAFGIDYKTMEKALKKYSKKRTFRISLATLPKKLVFDKDMKVSKLPEAVANAYLGDLLYHTHEYNDAEVYLQKALALDANQSLANTSLGLVRMRQGKFDEAKTYLEKAVAYNRKNHFAHYNYAYVLSRESQDEFGFVSSFPKEKATAMRKSLSEAIELNPEFSESYKLLAFINLVNNENLDEAISYLNKGLKLQPGNQEYGLLLGQIYLRQEKFDKAENLLAKIAKTAIEPQIRSNANNYLETVKRLKESQARFEKDKEELKKQGFNPPVLKKQSTLSDEDLKKIKLENQINGINRQISQAKTNEKRVVGYIQKVECLNGGVKYTLKTSDGELILKSVDFQGLNLMSYSEESETVLLDCGADLKELKSVFIYKNEADELFGSKGNLLSINFVPEFFTLKTAQEIKKIKPVVIVDDTGNSEVPTSVKEDSENNRVAQMLAQIKASLRKPQANEIRKVGVLKEIKCSRKNVIFNMEVDGKLLKLRSKNMKDLKLVAFTSDAGGILFKCGTKPAPVKAVITYLPSKKKSKKYQGDIIALEFVPKSFKLK